MWRSDFLHVCFLRIRYARAKKILAFPVAICRMLWNLKKKAQCQFVLLCTWLEKSKCPHDCFIKPPCPQTRPIWPYSYYSKHALGLLNLDMHAFWVSRWFAFIQRGLLQSPLWLRVVSLSMFYSMQEKQAKSDTVSLMINQMNCMNFFLQGIARLYLKYWNSHTVTYNIT